MQSKEIIRKELLEKRRKMSESEVLEKSNRITKFFLESDIWDSVETVMSYLPLGNEVNTQEIHRFLWKKGIKVLVPFTDDKYDIHAVKLHPNETLIEGKFHVKIPKKLEFFEDTPDLVLVPCVGLDPSGNRIGFGKGCYDRYLRLHPTKTLGIVFEFQIIDSFEVSPYDVPLKAILTEEGFIK